MPHFGGPHWSCSKRHIIFGPKPEAERALGAEEAGVRLGEEDAGVRHGEEAGAASSLAGPVPL
jgi:hypothetical protein